jgi:hypothetical protein
MTVIAGQLATVFAQRNSIGRLRSDQTAIGGKHSPQQGFVAGEASAAAQETAGPMNWWRQSNHQDMRNRRRTRSTQSANILQKVVVWA